MNIIRDNGDHVSVASMSLDDWRKLMAEFLGRNPQAANAWDILGCVRGPDSPSERPNMSSQEAAAAYAGRRARKFKTVEVLREAMFFGVVGGCARSHKDGSVTLPPTNKWDHFDKHVARAARVLGLKIKEGE